MDAPTKPPSPWNTLHASVRGTGHAEDGIECHDTSAVRTITAGGRAFVVLACADGAGSALHAKLGSATACAAVIEAAVNALEAADGPFTEDDLAVCFAAAHQAVNAEARRLEVHVRQLSCTLLLAVLGPDASAYAQVGDGVIVFRENQTFRHAFWPDNGETANSTFFVGSPDYEQHLKTKLRPAARDVALLTDGLQALALKMAERLAHGPFFEPMFASLRAAESPDALRPGLEKFLDSAAVNARTDDDKTLVLATRPGLSSGPLSCTHGRGLG